MNTPAAKMNHVWWTLLAAPLLALVLIIVASVYFGVVIQGKDPQLIPQLVADSTPYQLVVLQVCLLLILMRSMKRDGLSWPSIGWKLMDGQQLWRQGGSAGVVCDARRCCGHFTQTIRALSGRPTDH